MLATYDEINEVLRLDIETGVLYWRKITQGKKRWEAGCIGSDGYVVIKFKRKVYTAQNIVWLLIHGKWPPEYHLGQKAKILVDHINRRRNDNRPANLRLVSRFGNSMNRGTLVGSIVAQWPLGEPLDL